MAIGSARGSTASHKPEENDEQRSVVAIGSARSNTTSHKQEENDERRSVVAIGSARSSTASHKPEEKEKVVAGWQWPVSVAIISGEIVRRVEEQKRQRRNREKEK